ncbi:MAG TPA: 3-keto-5-aminohexanoate cleavage protein, partial [Alphaproteobacteria bacterium]|nr:3-keto-5-aminohexanoate cleavage protein [Alphaproteobacteria bacterium]
TNAELIAMFVDVAKSVGRDVATPEETRKILGMN